MFPILRQTELDSRTADFCQLTRLLMLGNGNVASARLAAERREDVSPRVKDILAEAQKAQPGSTFGWGSQLSQFALVAGAFSASLRGVGIFDALLAVANRVPLKSRTAVSVLAVTGTETTEGSPKLISELSISAADMPVRKFASIVVATEELLRLSAAESLLEAEMRNAVTAAVDNAFIDDLQGSVSPGGGSPPTTTTGAILSDVNVILSDLTLGRGSQPFIIVTPLQARQIATTAMAPGSNGGGPAFPGFSAVTGGVIAGARVLVSEHLNPNYMIGVDAAGSPWPRASWNSQLQTKLRCNCRARRPLHHW